MRPLLKEVSLFLKRAQVGRERLLPLGAVAVVLAASGSAATPSPSLMERAAAGHGTRPPGLASFCAQFWGEMAGDGSYCRFEQTYHLNLSHAGDEVVLTRLPIVATDTVSLVSRAPPSALVADESYDPRSFVASTSGYLALRAAGGQKFFTVQKVRLKRCFGQGEGSLRPVVCPRSEES